MRLQSSIRRPGFILLILVLSMMSQEGLSQTGPWNNPLKIAHSGDGQNFTTPVLFQDSAGVPSAVQWKGDTLVCVFQWFRGPAGSLTWDRVAVKFSYDSGITWTSPTPIVITGFPTDFQRPFDPTLAVVSPESLRIYYSSGKGMPQMGLDATIDTYSAISTDGIHYVFEPGPRVDHPTRRVIDPALVFFNGVWHYSSPVGAPQEGAHHYTSADGLNFTQQAGIPSDNTHNWTGNYLVENNSLLRFYGSGMRIWYSSSSDGFLWGSYVATTVNGGDPTVVKVGSSSYLMIFVGPPYANGAGVDRSPSPAGFALLQNYPNPFNASTVINYQLASASLVRLRVFDVLGNNRGELVRKEQGAGSHSVSFDASHLPSGVYLYRLQAGNFMEVRRMVLVR